MCASLSSNSPLLFTPVIVLPSNTKPVVVITPEPIVPIFTKFLLKSINCVPVLVPSPMYKPFSLAVVLSDLNLKRFLLLQVVSLPGKPKA